MRSIKAHMLICLAAVTAAGPAQASSEEALRHKIDRLTAPLIERLKQRVGDGELAVALKDPLFDPPQNFRTSGGRVLRDHVKAVLAARHVKFSDDGKYRLQGKFRMKTMNDANDGAPPYAVIIQMSLLDANDEPVGPPVAENIQDPEVIAPLVGATAQVPPVGRGRLAKMAEAIERPEFALDANGTVVRAATGSKYGVELLVGKSGGAFTPRAVQKKDGLPFIALRPGEEYRLRIHNDSNEDLAVEIRIDGRSVFHRAVDLNDRTMQHWSIGRGRKLPILGWYLSKDGYEPFVVEGLDPAKPLPDAATPGEIGMVTVQFHQAWDATTEGPPDDLRGGLSAQLPQEVITGAGAEVKQRFNVVEKKVGGAREFVTIRYNTRPE